MKNAILIDSLMHHVPGNFEGQKAFAENICSAMTNIEKHSKNTLVVITDVSMESQLIARCLWHTFFIPFDFMPKQGYIEGFENVVFISNDINLLQAYRMRAENIGTKILN